MGVIYDGLLHLVGASSLWPFDWVLLTSTLVASTPIIFFVELMRLKKKNFSKKKKIVKET